MIVVLGLGTVLANLVGGPVGNFLTLLLGGASLGALTAAWASMIAAFLAPAEGQGRGAAFNAAPLDRWASQGLIAGSSIGLALAILDILLA
jgi:hypothetical protein